MSCVLGNAGRHVLAEFVDATRQRGHGSRSRSSTSTLSSRQRTRSPLSLSRRIAKGWVVARIEHRRPEAGPAIAELRGTAHGSGGATTGVLTTPANLQG